MARHFISQDDLTPAEMNAVFELSTALKGAKSSADLSGKTLVMFFEKASTRTRLSFEIGMTQLGGHAVYLDRDSSQLSRGESIADTSRVISRYADIMMARVYDHRTVSELAAYSDVPVINGLSDEEHPCQSMADLFTILEKKGGLRGLRLAYCGDGRNNVAHSLLLACAKVGMDLRIASPISLVPLPQFLARAQNYAGSSGSNILVTQDPDEAVREADIVYTDVWVSMGQESERRHRLNTLMPYQVRAKLVRLAAPNYLFMHCLPAHVGEEVSSEVAYGPHSVIFDQAENRLHVQKALMLFLLQTTRGGRE